MKKRLDSAKFDEAARKTVSEEASLLEKRILSDLAEMITEAHTSLTESKVFQEFKTFLNGRIPLESDILYLKNLIEGVVFKNDATFEKFFDVIVERDRKNRAMIGFEFKVKPNLFKG